MLIPIRTVAPAATPISLDDVKRHCRVTEPDEDTLLLSLIDAAVALLDGWAGIMGRALVTQTWQQSFPWFGGGLRLSLGPAVSLSSVTYFDANNVQQTLSVGVYRLLTDELGPYVGLQPNQSWPGYFGREDAVSVTWVAGESVSLLPSAIKLGMKMLVAHWYENREHVIIGQSAMEIPWTVEHLLEPYRRRGPTHPNLGFGTIPYAQLWPILD